MQPTAVFFYNPKGIVPDPINYDELAAYVLKFPFVKQVWKYGDFLWNEENLLSRIEMHQLERLIIAGPKPGIVKTLFSKIMLLAGKDPENVILASFAEQGIRKANDIDRTKSLLAASLYDIPYEIAVVPEEFPVDPATLIIGGGIAGKQAALEIANSTTWFTWLKKAGRSEGKWPPSIKLSLPSTAQPVS